VVLRLRYVVVALCALLTACADRTSLLVEVTSDLIVPDDVNQLQITVVGDVEGQMVDQTYDLTSQWPHTISVRPGQVEDQGVAITVVALRDGAFVARRFQRSEFDRGEQTLVQIHIDAACRGITCDPGVDCVNGRCVDREIDGGMRDAGMPDAGCMSAGDCDDSVNCTIDTCDNGSCSHEPDDGLCAEGSTCDVETGCPPRVCSNDAECNDGVACNGVEVCVEMACAAGPPIDCSDEDPCTADLCDEPNRGECVHTTVDADGDGFGDAMCPEVGGVPASDCNDDNPDAFPEAPELCNGIDDDCNVVCDDSFTCCRGEIGTCPTMCGTTGTRVCNTSCSWDVCVPPPEMCNGVDDNCTGGADEIFACVQGASEACTTSCGSMGTRTCQGDCTWTDCMPPEETCSGRDDDCDSNVDEGFDCVQNSVADCATSCMTTGTRTCTASCTMGATCDPPAEGCNGIDDNCDGRVDESNECVPGTMENCMTTCGTTGRRTCSAMCVFGSCVPPAETCNGQDDNCDGRVDETFTCVRGSTGSCTTSCNNGAGSRVCNNSCAWGSCTAPAESCDGRDNDCDSMCDETFSCCANSTGLTCQTSCMTTGTRTCSAACGLSVCSPPPEVCNGQDDDCNGGCDDTFTCCANRMGTCTTSCGSMGTRTCNPDCTWPSCNPPAETCNGLDDDCDSNIDETFACTPGAVQSCTTACGSTGTSTCDSACNFGMCQPPTESCNGVDDDCDGMTDEGCGVCGSCPGATAVAPPGGRFNVTLGPHSQTGSCGGAGGSEGYLTFTLAVQSDVFIATHHAGALDTVVYLRSCTCAGTEVGAACNDNADGRNTSRLQLNLPPGTYNLVVDTKASMVGTVVPVDVYITPTGMPSDRCGNPTFIPAGTTSLTGTTCGFTADTAPIACQFTGAGGAEDRVFYFYLPTARVVSVSGCTATTVYDQTLYARASCTDADQVACNDDGCGGSSTSCSGGLRSSWSTTLGPGLFYLFVDGFPDATCPCGNYGLTITGL
jgi:hypothetical protein